MKLHEEKGDLSGCRRVLPRMTAAQLAEVPGYDPLIVARKQENSELKFKDYFAKHIKVGLKMLLVQMREYIHTLTIIGIRLHE